jgi:hypothetical protein
MCVCEGFSTARHPRYKHEIKVNQSTTKTTTTTTGTTITTTTKI